MTKHLAQKTRTIIRRKLFLAAIATSLPLSFHSFADAADATTQPSAATAVPHANETPAERDERMAWWRAARFGLFIHWGLYSVPAGFYDGKPVHGIGEWIMRNGKIPVAVYAKYAEQFNPTKFDAEKWVSIAEAAGQKYIVITAKHHDGFAMYHSSVDSYNIYDATPFHRDPLAELATACRKHGIKLGFYYSQAQDWHAPGGAPNGAHWDPAQNGNFATYQEKKAVPQVKELLSNYGEFPAVLWFDTPIDMNSQLAAAYFPLLNSKPNLIVNNRLGGGFKGDTETPEQHIPPQGYPGQDWETCMTINNTWGYKSDDNNFKSPESLLHNLIDIASKGGNYLLNVGPTSEGVIPQPEVDRLLAIGQWLKVNGEAIYGTGPTSFGSEAGSYDPVKVDNKGKPVWNAKWDWRCTTAPHKIFIHLMKWPNGAFKLTGLKSKVDRAYLLADTNHANLAVHQDDSGVSIDLPSSAPDPIASVLCLEIADQVPATQPN